MNRLRLLLCLALAVAFVLPAHAARQKPTRPQKSDLGTYRGYIVIDAASGTVLAEENADIVNPPASMTKLMTFAVISDALKSGNISLDTPVKIENEDAHMGGTQVYLDPRETFPVEELLYAMLIHSANDAAHALARVTGGGSVPAFIQMMNAKARAIGMSHSVFRTPHGLTSERQSRDEADLTTPRDYAILCRYLILNTDILKYTSVQHRPFGMQRAKGAMQLDNSNKLLGRVAGVDGLKTGYTKHAGYCLSATAERNGRRVIGVIMGCFGPAGRETDFGRSRDLKMAELLGIGFVSLQNTAAMAVPAPAQQAQPASPAPQTTAPAATPKPAVKQPTAKPAPATTSATSRPAPSVVPSAAPVSPADASPIQPANASPVTAAEPASEPAPAIKFEMPKKP
jgi:D-alanyl-D-alanine carboxypeptidase (penicillin-binding protein 5/6)